MRAYISMGIGILYMLIIVGLIAAKFIGHLHWAWWLVLTPLWAPVALLVLAVMLGVAGLAGAQSRGENPFQ